MRTSNEPLVISNSGDMSQATLTSNPILWDQMYAGSFQAFFTGSPVGTLKLQASLDPSTLNSPAPTNWSDITQSFYSVTAAGNWIWDIGATGTEWIRLVYTKTSGTGTLTARVKTKGGA